MIQECAELYMLYLELCETVQCAELCRLGADYLCPAELHFNLTAAAFVRLSRCCSVQ